MCHSERHSVGFEGSRVERIHDEACPVGVLLAQHDIFLIEGFGALMHVCRVML